MSTRARQGLYGVEAQVMISAAFSKHTQLPLAASSSSSEQTQQDAFVHIVDDTLPEDSYTTSDQEAIP